MEQYKPLFTLQDKIVNFPDNKFEPVKPMQPPTLSDEQYAKILTIPQPIGGNCFMQNIIIDKIINKQ